MNAKKIKTVADLDAELQADLQAEKEAREAYEEERRLMPPLPEGYSSWAEWAFYDNEANAWDAELGFIRDDFSPRRPLPQVDPGTSGEGHYPF